MFKILPPIENQLTPVAKHSILRAVELALERGGNAVTDTDLFIGILQTDKDESGVIAAFLTLTGVTRDEAELYARSTLPSSRDLRSSRAANGSDAPHLPLSPGARRTLRQAQLEARWGQPEGHQTILPVVGNEHIFLACLRQQRGSHVGEVLRPLGFDAVTLHQHLRGLNQSDQPYSAGSPLNYLTESSRKAIEAAHAAMRATFCGHISTAHLLLGLLSDAENGAVETLHAANIDIEKLRVEVRASIFNDGHIATPQKKLSPAAKRALERAHREADEVEHSFIGPQHLLHALLPRPISVAEKLAFGSTIDDPLERVWPHWPVAEIQRQYERLWVPEEPLPEVSKTPPEYIKVKGVWMLAGIAWWVWILADEFGFVLLMGAFVLALAYAIRGESQKKLLQRDRYASFCFGMLVGIFFALFLLARG